MVRLFMTTAVIISVSISVTECRSLSRANVCDRWNCPCLGSTVTYRPRHHAQKRFDLWERAHYARNKTKSLLEQMVSYIVSVWEKFVIYV